MTGPPDQVAEQAHNPDSVRLREPDRIATEIRERMERLPPGHPSSPYNDDGSRKPPPPDPFEHDLPIPGDPDYQPDLSTDEADHSTDDSSEGAGESQDAADRDPTGEELAGSGADRSPDTEDTPRIGPDGSWEWKGFPLTNEQSRLGDHGIAKCRGAEGRDENDDYGEDGLTPAMRRIEAQLACGKLVPDTEKFALKSADRFKLKLAERINAQPGEAADLLVSRIHDGIRYTFVYDDQDYTIGIEETEAALGESSYDLITRKPSWDSSDYKGVNSQWRDPNSGLLFEVQFHTHASWDAKQKTHLAYEQLADPRITPEERARLDEYQRTIAVSVSIPTGALEIPYYNKEGT